MPTRFSAAAESLRRRGVVLREYPGFYSVNLRSGGMVTEYRTEALADALAHGMAMEVTPAPPPLGPGSTRRALMYRHNRKLAAKRAQAAGKGHATPCV